MDPSPGHDSIECSPCVHTLLITFSLTLTIWTAEQVMTFALQVYVPAEYQGPQDASSLGTIWLGYIPTQYVSTLAAQIKVTQSAFYIGVSDPVARELALQVNSAFPLLSINVSGTGAGSGSGSSGSGSGGGGNNTRQDAIIGVVTVLGAIALLVLAFLIYRSIMRRRELTHRRLSDAPQVPDLAGIAPQGRDFDQDSVGGARRRSFYWAEDSLRGFQAERGEDNLGAAQVTAQSLQSGPNSAVRRSVLPGNISAPVLRESSMNW